jgi:hypothetical protein
MKGANGESVLSDLPHSGARDSTALRWEGSMRAALRQVRNFLGRLGRRFYEARQAKAECVVNEHRHFYRYYDRLE